MNRIIKTTLVLLFAGLTALSSAQTYELSKAGTAVVVKGTSSLHDWEMDLSMGNSAFSLSQEGTTLKGFENVTFTCKATDLKSESSLMDSKAHEALKAKDFPEIKFTGTSAAGVTTDGKKFNGNLKGKLVVAGKSQDITIPFNGTITDAKTININASTDLTMSSFSIAPPTAMLGTLKTGDKVSVQFTLQFVQKAQ